MKRTALLLALTLVAPVGAQTPPPPSTNTAAQTQALVEEMSSYTPLYRVLGGLENRRAYLAVYQKQDALNVRLEENWTTLIREAQQTLEEIRKLGAPAMAEGMKLQLALLVQQHDAQKGLRELQEILAANALGRNQQAIQKMLSMADGSPDDIARSLRGTVMAMCFQMGRPDLVEPILPLYQGQTPVEKAAAETVRLALEEARHPDRGIDDFLAAHQRCWPVLLKASGEEEGAFQSWALGYWPARCGRLIYRLDGAHPSAARLRSLLELDLKELQPPAQASFLAPPVVAGKLNPDWSLWRWDAEMELLLDLAGRAREAGLLEECQAYLRRFEEVGLPAISGAPTRFQPLLDQVMTPKGIPCDLKEGVLSRLPGRYQQEMAHLLESRQNGKPSSASVQLLEQALIHFQQARSIQARQAKIELALAAFQCNQEPRSLSWLEEALAEARQAQDRRAEIQSRLALGQVLAGLGQSPRAISELQEATRQLESQISELGGDHEAAAVLRQPAKPAYELLARLQTEAGQPQAAFDALGRLQQVEQFGEVMPERRPGQLGNQLRELQVVRQQLRGLEQEAVALHALPEAGQVLAGARQNSAQLLASKKGQFYSLVGKIREGNPEFESALAVRPTNFSEIQPNIPKDTVVVQYFPAGQQLYFFVATRENLKIRSLALTSQELDQWVTQYREALKGIARGNLSREGLDRLSRQLYQALIEPVEPDLQDKALVALIPSGSLYYLPFQALQSSSGRYLIEAKQVVVLSKSSDLERLARPPRAGGGGLVAFGNPDGSLPGSEKEVRAIGQLVKGSQMVLAGQATKDRLTRECKNPQLSWLHLATHGVLNGRDPSLSYLVLAGASESGRLTAAEVADLELGQKTRLVTLSACQTALGEGKPGSEVLSLADAFRWAGSPTLLASLWSVSDDATQELMVEFYRQLQKGARPSLALQLAEIRMLQQPRFNHPFFWSAFVLVGDWR